MGFFVKFWGVRGSIPTPGWQTRRYGGNTSCYEVRVDDTTFILDAGTGLRELGESMLKRARQEKKPVSAHMMFSHPHWDHIQGFPFFTPVYMRDNVFHIYDREGAEKKHFELLSGQMKSDYFPVEFSDLGAHVLSEKIDAAGRTIEGVKVTYLSQVHPGGSLAYAFERDGVKLVYATDNELDLTLVDKDMPRRDPSARRKVSQAYLDFIRGADLLVADGQYTDDEYGAKVGWGHARATTLVDAAVEAGVKRLAISHHDPMQTDDQVDEKVIVCRRRAEKHGSDLVVFGAREKVELRLDESARKPDDAD